MDSKELKAALTKPQIARLKQLTNGLRVGRVLGDRVLVKLVEPMTEMDRIEKSGLLVVPETVRDANTPLPTTGIVVQVGDDVCAECLAEGSMIMFSKYAGSDVFFNEEAFRIMETREILCTLEAVDESVPVVQPIGA